jgi:hypothetical protein
MANPYTTTITFPKDYVNETDTIQLVLILTTEMEGTNLNVTDPKASGIIIKDYGTLSYDWNFDSSLLVYSQLNIIITDVQKYLHDFIFGYSSVALKTRFYFTVKFYINDGLVFKGKPIDDTIEWDESENTLSFTAIPFLDALNYSLYDSSGVANAELPALLGIADYSSPISLVSIIEKIFSIADSSFYGYVYHKWDFQDALANVVGLSKVQLPELDTVFANSSVAAACGLSTLKDVLRYFGDAFQFNYLLLGELYCIRQLYCAHYPVALTNVISHKKRFDHTVYKYVYVFSDTGDHNHSESVGLKSSIDSENFEITQYFDAYTEADTRVISNLDNDSRIEIVTDQNKFLARVPVGSRLVHTVSASVSFFRANWVVGDTVDRSRQTDEFIVRGVELSPQEDITYDGNSYFVMGMDKDFKNNRTTIKAMFLGEPFWP